MSNLRAVVLLTVALAGAPVPAYAGPLDDCSPFAAPPRAEAGELRGDGGVYCPSGRGSVTLDVCLEELYWLGGWQQVSCASVTGTGNVSLVLGWVTGCDIPEIPFVRTAVYGWTDGGESLYAESVSSAASCG